jgi:hypothetical protein
MSATVQTVAATTLQTALAVAQVLAATNPKLAAAIAIEPFIVQLVESVEQMQQAGTLTPAALADLFARIGAGIQSTHDTWATMNAADTARAP